MPSIFCFTVLTAWPYENDTTIPLLEQQLRMCDSSSLYSWYSEPAFRVEKIFDRVIVRPKPQTAPPTISVWQHIMSKMDSNGWSTFDWYVLIEADTLLDPHNMKEQLALVNLNASEPLAFGTGACGGTCGAFAALSRGGLHKLAAVSKRLTLGKQTCGSRLLPVDTWFSKCVRSTSGIRFLGWKDFVPPEEDCHCVLPGGSRSSCHTTNIEAAFYFDPSPVPQDSIARKLFNTRIREMSNELHTYAAGHRNALLIPYKRNINMSLQRKDALLPGRGGYSFRHVHPRANKDSSRPMENECALAPHTYDFGIFSLFEEKKYPFAIFGYPCYICSSLNTFAIHGLKGYKEMAAVRRGMASVCASQSKGCWRKDLHLRASVRDTRGALP